ncbi:MAG: hypothetical protein M3044_12825 [Thermoproteota archaeon]|nr:hypothetical protein [Thermoproteota archaeon]
MTEQRFIKKDWNGNKVEEIPNSWQVKALCNNCENGITLHDSVIRNRICRDCDLALHESEAITRD